MKLHALFLELELPQNLCNIEANRHFFAKIAKLHSEHPKKGKSIENGSRKFSQCNSLFLCGTEESKRGTVWNLKELLNSHVCDIVGSCYTVIVWKINRKKKEKSEHFKIPKTMDNLCKVFEGSDSNIIS